MKTIGCLFVNLGLTEDRYLLPFVLKHRLPVIAMRSFDPGLVKRLLQKGIRVYIRPKDVYFRSDFFRWLRKVLAKSGILSLIMAHYFVSETQEAVALPSLQREFQDVFFIQVGHGMDDRYFASFKPVLGYDLILFDNHYWANLFRKLHKPKQKTETIGNIQLASFLKRGKRAALNAKPLFYKKRGLAIGKKTVLYAPSWFRGKRGDIEGNGFFERCGVDICSSIPPDVNVIVKPHPVTLGDTDEKGPLAQFKQTFKSRKNMVLVEEPRDIMELISYADLIISDHSAVCPLSLGMGKNLIVFDPTKKPIFRDFIVRHCDYVKDIKALGGVIRASLKNPARNHKLRKKFIAESGFLNLNAVEDAWRIITKSIACAS